MAPSPPAPAMASDIAATLATKAETSARENKRITLDDMLKQTATLIAMMDELDTDAEGWRLLKAECELLGPAIDDGIYRATFVKHQRDIEKSFRPSSTRVDVDKQTKVEYNRT